MSKSEKFNKLAFIGFKKKALLLGITALSSLCLFTACNHDHLPPQSTGGRDYLQVNLVSDTEGYGANRIDGALGNPCGIAMSPKGRIWISCTRTGQSVIYDSNGVQLFNPVKVPLNSTRNASPDGMVYNGTADFAVNGAPARCIYASEEGTISAWTVGDSTVTVADRSAQNTSYKGLTIANDGTGNYIYATDFYNNKIDVFDKNFNSVAGRMFADPGIPSNYGPYNICFINGNLYVTYALRKTTLNHYDSEGPGNGYVDVFNLNGTLIKRFATRGVLNAPWGITAAPVDFGQGANAILVANNGDGRINVFDSSGAYLGPLENQGVPIVIDGIWDIVASPTNNRQFYFSAGPGDEAHGVFGYLMVK